MSFIFIDRRKAGKGKSSNNRQKLMNRIRGFIQQAAPSIVGSSGVTATTKGTSPVKVAADALEEPFFAYANNGGTIMVLPGNTEYTRGDTIYIPQEGDGEGDGNGAGHGQSNGEDDFIVEVAAEEFYDMFFEDCELPNLTEEVVERKVDTSMEHAGFSTNGNPAQLSVVRTYKQSLGRRRALKAPYIEEIIELENELESLSAFDLADMNEMDAKHPGWDQQNEKRRQEIIARLEELERKISHLDAFDKVDLRFRKKEAKPAHSVEAVLIMIMDISGSMDMEKKTISRRWFALLYQFIKRRYGSTDVVFVAHTEEAMEMTEKEFFSTRVNGGTTASSGLVLAKQIIEERYSSGNTNIYISHASDGDNWEDDTVAVINELKGLIPMLRYFSYVEVGNPYSNQTSLWTSYDHVRKGAPSKTMSLAAVHNESECYDVFKEVFKK